MSLWKRFTYQASSRNYEVCMRCAKQANTFFSFSQSEIHIYLVIFRTTHNEQLTYFLKWLYERGLHYKPLPEIMKFLCVAQNKPTHFSLSLSQKFLFICLLKDRTLWTTTYLLLWLYERGLHIKHLPEIMKFLRVAQNKPTHFSLSLSQKFLIYLLI